MNTGFPTVVQWWYILPW